MTAVRAVWGPAAMGTWSPPGTGAVLALNDADNSVCWRFFVPKDGTITDVGFWCSVVTGNPPAYNVGLVTVTASTGAPTTTDYGGSTKTTTDYTATGWTWSTLAVAATAAAGDLVAGRIWPTASAPDASNYASIVYAGLPANGPPTSMYYSVAWADTNRFPAMAVRYQDGTVYGLSVTAWSSEELESDTTPDEAGAAFTLPAAMTCVGARIGLHAVDPNAPFTVKLYDSSDTLLASAAISDEDAVGGTGEFDVYWDAVNLTAGPTYRLTVVSDSTTLGVTPGMYVFDAAASLANNIMLPEAANWQKTERTDAGAWTQTANKCPHMGLIISDITFSTGAAAGGASAHMG